MLLNFIKECVLATRPYSFTAAIVPILVTTAIVAPKNPFLQLGFLRAMIMGITVQSGANLTNTYFDYKNGIDTKECVLLNGDITLVEKKLTPNTVLTLAFICYTLGLCSVYPILIASSFNVHFIYVFLIGIILSLAYTANPIGLKYLALGDITIFLCFGPLLMQATSILVSGTMTYEIIPYSIPIGLLTEAILHANNTRDIKPDTKANIITLAILLGYENSYLFYLFLLVSAYLSVAIIAYYSRWACILSFLTLPLAMQLSNGFKKHKMDKIVEETAKFHLPFGVLLFIGVLVADSGLVAMF